MKSLFFALSLCVALALSASTSVEAKRAAKPKVDSIVNGTITYYADDGDAEKMGHVYARNTKTNALIWKVKVYEVKIDENLEKDIQWVFISSMKLKDGKLTIENEKGKKFEVDVKTQKVKSLK